MSSVKRLFTLLVGPSFVLGIKVEQLRGRPREHIRKRTLDDASRVLKHKSSDSFEAQYEAIPLYEYPLDEHIYKLYYYPEQKPEYYDNPYQYYEQGYNYPEYETGPNDHHHPYYYYYEHHGSADEYHAGYYYHPPDYYYYYPNPKSQKMKKKSKKHKTPYHHMEPYVRWQPLVSKGKGHWPNAKPTPAAQPVAAKTRSPTPPNIPATFVPAAPVSSIPPVVPPVLPPDAGSPVLPPTSATGPPTAPTEPPSNSVLPPTPSTVDPAGNAFGEFIGTFDQLSDIRNAAIERFGIISITYNVSGIFADYSLGCGNRQPITPRRVELGLLQWTEIIDFGAETCANGNITLTESLDGISWDYLWVGAADNGEGLATGVLNGPIVEPPATAPVSEAPTVVSVGPTATGTTSISDAPSPTPTGDTGTTSPTATFAPTSTNRPTFVVTSGPSITAFPSLPGVPGASQLPSISGTAASSGGSMLPSIVSSSALDPVGGGAMEAMPEDDPEASATGSSAGSEARNIPPPAAEAEEEQPAPSFAPSQATILPTGSFRPSPARRGPKLFL